MQFDLPESSPGTSVAVVDQTPSQVTQGPVNHGSQVPLASISLYASRGSGKNTARIHWRQEEGSCLPHGHVGASPARACPTLG